MKRLLVFVAAVALAGCQAKEVTEMSYSEVKSLVVQKGQECVAQGVKPHTKEMQTCVNHEMNAEQTRRKNWNARRQATASSSTYCQAFGNSIQCF